jgi:small subunit ribosomal protein S19
MARDLNIQVKNNSDQPDWIKDKPRNLMKSNSKKLPFVHPDDVESFRNQVNTHVPIRVHRSTTIIPKMENCTIEVHNGKGYIKRKVTPEMIGCKAGEFAETRVPTKHPEKKNDLKKKKERSKK